MKKFKHFRLYEVSYSMFSKKTAILPGVFMLLFFLTTNVVAQDLDSNNIESKTVTVSTMEWTAVSFNNDYINPVILATPVYVGDQTPPTTVRVRNIIGNDCEIKLAMLSTITDNDYDLKVNLIIVEEGIYTIAEHGIAMEVAKVEVSTTDFQGNFEGQNFTFSNSYIKPVVLGQVITADDSNWSTFWSKEVTSDSAIIGKQVAEDSNKTRSVEQVAVVVIEAGNYSFDFADIAAGTNRVIGFGSDNKNPITGMPAADAVIISQNSMEGSNGGFPVIIGNATPLEGELSVVIDEDQFKDDERQHVSEEISWVSIKFANEYEEGIGDIQSKEDKGGCFILSL